jgi:hypothetical protein
MALALILVPAGAQQPALQDELLDRMIGNWVLEGTIAGKATTHDVRAEWVLGHRYVRLHEVSREKDAAGKPQYEAEVYVGWNPEQKQYGCAWLDTYGGLLPVSLALGKRSGDEIPFVFRDEKSVFHTTFRWVAAKGEWEWQMDSEEKDGRLKPFARVRLTRAK